MFHIVGTNHDLQHDGEPVETTWPAANKAREQLKKYLHKLADQTHPILVAEELSEWYLTQIKKGAGSILKQVADGRSDWQRIPYGHRFCDPDRDKRNALNLDIGSHPCTPDLLRECYWLACLLDVLKHDVLFVCGAVHVKSFSSLLRNRGIALRVRTRYFGRRLFKPCGSAGNAVSD